MSLEIEMVTSETFGVNSRDQKHYGSVFIGIELLAKVCCSMVPKVELHHRPTAKQNKLLRI